MCEETEAKRNLRIRLRETLLSPEPPAFPTKLKWILDMRLNPRSGGEMIGMLPIELQHLCVLALKLEEEFSAEMHRRCVELFGKEEYDNEALEYMIHQEVEKDPHFNQAGRVWNMLSRRVYRNWRRHLVTSKGHEVVFYIDHHFRLFKTKYRKLTADEIIAKISQDLKSAELTPPT